MTKHSKNLFKRSALAIAVTSSMLPLQHAIAQEDELQIEKIEVTATRRSGTVQEVPLNITALSDDVLEQQNIDDLADIARWVPGLTIQDQGGRSGSPIIVRGLNTNSSGPGSDAGTVATYYGEIPLAIDLRLTDVQRVEVLIGPQGTLYGAGTLGGAIRYIPKKAELDVTSGKVYGDVFNVAEGGTGGEAGFVFNTPLIDDELALRLNFNHYDDPGFIDYNYVVQQGGVSLPDPDWSDESAVNQNLKRVEDANGETTTTARAVLRWAPNDTFDATLQYLYQKQDLEGRSIVHYDSLGSGNPLKSLVGKYESAYRYEEPREKEDSLLSLEMTVDLEFAELVSATGLSKFEADGQRDQTDLLIRLDYGYEEFPAFSSFTRELDNSDVFTHEMRLVSKGDSALSWIAGFYYSTVETDGSSSEFTPGFDQFAVDEFGGIQTRPDSLEYLSVSDSKTTEKAFFGEVSYAVNEQLDFTLGARVFKYDVYSRSAIDLPLFYTVFDGRDPNSIVLDYSEESAGDDGDLLKFNVSYKFTPDVMGYFTVSEGFRIGGSNGVAACPSNIDDIDNQIVCALPNEVIFVADTTSNMELGIKSTWFKNRFHFNAAVFDVDWDDAQVSGATVNGQQPITSNAEGANSKGIELSARAIISDELTAYATFASAKAELTSDAPFLFGVIDDAGTALQDFYDGKSGDRLPGSPERQFSFGMNYTTDVMDDKLLEVNYGMTHQSNIYSKVGLRADGESIPGFAVHNLSARLSDEQWALTLYIDNMFDKYAYTSVRRDKGDIGLATFPSQNQNGTNLTRNYGHFLLTPRTIGLRFEYNFEL